MAESPITPEERDFEFWAKAVFGRYVPAPNTPLASTFDPATPPGRLIADAMRAAGLMYEGAQLQAAARLPGDVLLFGELNPERLDRVRRYLADHGHQGRLYGFDRFHGEDGPARQEACRARMAGHERVVICHGWYADVFQRAEAQRIGLVSHVRLCVPQAQGCTDILDFLTDRLADGAALQVDHVSHRTDQGPALALRDWYADHETRFRLECEALNATHTLHLRVHHR